MAVFKKETIFVIAVVLLAFVIRLVNLNQSLWWDEAINIIAVQENNLRELVTSYSLADFHPPGYFIILWIWGKLFGYSEIAMRLPSVVFSVWTVYIVYLLGKRVSGERVGVIAALLLVVSPLHIYYSQEARMYSFAAFAVALSMYFFLGLLKKSKVDSIGYAFSLFILFYSDYVAYLALIAQFLYIIFIRRDIFKRYLTYFLFGAISILPWLFVFSQQFMQGIQTAEAVSGWKNVVGGAGVKQAVLLPVKILIGRISFENNLLYAASAGFAGLLHTFALYRAIKKLNKNILLLLFWVIIPPLVAYIASFWVPIFSYFRLLFILPAVVLILGEGIEHLRGIHYKIVIFLLVLTNIIFSSMYLFNSNFHREDWKGVTEFVINDFRDKSIVLFEDVEVAKPFVYYGGDTFESKGAIDQLPAYEISDLKDLNVLLAEKDRVYMFEYLRDITDPNRVLEAEIKNLGFSESEVYDFRGVGFVRIFDRIN